MVGLAQLAERLVVVQEVAGSTPVAHPTEIGSRAGFHKGRTGYPVRPLLLTEGTPDLLRISATDKGRTDMTVLPVTIWGEPVLHRRASEVEVFDDELRTLIADMFETNDAANGVGLAAPQIGVGKRIFVYKYANDDDVPEQGVVVNPVLTLSKVSGALPDPDEDVEGCLSFPGEYYPLQRAEWTRVQGFDGQGNPVDFEATGWFARILQHEFDHLDGKLYVNRLVDRYSKKALKQAKKKGWGVPGLTWMPGVDPDPFGH
jgi:peptide deformylase